MLNLYADAKDQNAGMESNRHLAYAMEIADFYWKQIVSKKKVTV